MTSNLIELTPSEPGNAQTAAEGISRQFCTLWVSGKFFGFDILDVKEVNLETDFTPISHSPAEVKGYVNVRGQIYLILDLRVLLGLDAGEIRRESRLVLFKPSIGEAIGVLVDKVGDVLTVDAAQIEGGLRGPQKHRETAQASERENDHTTCICKLDDTLLVILDPRSLLQSTERSVLKGTKEAV